MTRHRGPVPLTLAIALLIIPLIVPQSARAGIVDSVAVESQQVCAGAKDVIVRVRVTNATEIRHLTVPLEIRAVKGGAFITALKLSWGDRLPPGKTMPLGDFALSHHYDQQDCTCERTGKAGYTNIAYSDTLSHAVEISPYGILFSRIRLMGSNLAIGRDSVGSLIMTMDINSHPGSFEIDTTCVCPANHLMFVSNTSPPHGLDPSFQKGVITVEDCAKK